MVFGSDRIARRIRYDLRKYRAPRYNRIDEMTCSRAHSSKSMIQARLRSFAHCRRGANAVEFALVAPILFFLLLGICYVSVYLSIGHSLAQLAADTSRHAIAGLDRTERLSLAGQWPMKPGNAYGLVDMSRLSVSADERAGALRVTIAYDVSYLPVPPIVGAVVRLPKVMQRSSTIMVH